MLLYMHVCVFSAAPDRTGILMLNACSGLTQLAVKKWYLDVCSFFLTQNHIFQAAMHLIKFRLLQNEEVNFIESSKQQFLVAFWGLSAVSGWVSKKPWKQAASSVSPSRDILLKFGFKVLIFPCLWVALTPENVCRVGVVPGVSFAEAVAWVIDPLGKRFTYIICISRDASFTWCLRGGELTVYPASRINTGAGGAKLQKYTWIFSISLVAQACVLFEFPVYIWFFSAIRNESDSSPFSASEEPDFELCFWPR